MVANLEFSSPFYYFLVMKKALWTIWKLQMWKKNWNSFHLSFKVTGLSCIPYIVSNEAREIVLFLQPYMFVSSLASLIFLLSLFSFIYIFSLKVFLKSTKSISWYLCGKSVYEIPFSVPIWNTNHSLFPWRYIMLSVNILYKRLLFLLKLC